MVKNVCFVSNYDVKSAKRGTKTESEVLVGGGEKRAKKLVQFACLQERISAERRLNVFVCAIANCNCVKRNFLWNFRYNVQK